MKALAVAASAVSCDITPGGRPVHKPRVCLCLYKWNRKAYLRLCVHTCVSACGPLLSSLCAKGQGDCWDRIQSEGHSTRTGPATNGPIKIDLWAERVCLHQVYRRAHTRRRERSYFHSNGHLFPDDNNRLYVGINAHHLHGLTVTKAAMHLNCTCNSSVFQIF